MSQKILDTGNNILTERVVPRIDSNRFDLSHDLKLSCEAGLLIPIMMQEMIPGDHFHVTPECLVRLQPLIAPVMHRIKLRSEWFFVPTRLLWPQWEDFISPPGVGAVAPSVPVFMDVHCTPNSLSDYLGVPPEYGDQYYTNVVKMLAFQHCAYQLVWHEWYRDENLNPFAIKPQLYSGNNGNQAADNPMFQLRRRNWDRDYFTSALPWPQKGPNVNIPINSSGGGLVNYIGGTPKILAGASGDPAPAGSVSVAVKDASTSHFLSGSEYLAFDPNNTLAVSGFTATGGTINDLRRAEQLQTFLEADARGGTRYIETIKQHYGVNSSDSRLQRPEYCGSTTQRIIISEVLQTSDTGNNTPQGTMAGHGVSADTHGSIDYYAEEFGYFVGLMSILPDTGYNQGLHKQFQRFDRLDFPWPEFANLGEQPLMRNELLYAGNDNPVFGYVPMYSELRTQYDRIAGDFRDSLNYWHMSREWTPETGLPALNKQFIEADPTTRIFAVEGTPQNPVQHYLCEWYFKFNADRKIPRHVRPSL